MTTHQLAKELMKLPDVPLAVEGWTGRNIVATMTGYDPDGTAILVDGEYFRNSTANEPKPQKAFSIK